jgi:hypothetical protein
MTPIQVLGHLNIDIEAWREDGTMVDDSVALSVLSRTPFANLAFLYPRADLRIKPRI